MAENQTTDAMNEALAVGIDIHATPLAATHKPALVDRDELTAKLFWSVPETAFMCGVSVRSVWRLMADPRSGFPTPRRVRGRTLLDAEEVLTFMQEGAAK